MIRTALGAALLLLLGGVPATESGSPVTAGPAVLVHDFFPGASEGSHPPSQLTRLGQALFFIGDDRESGPSLWRSDGTPGGSFLVAVDGIAGPFESPQILGVVGGRLLWSAYVAADPTHLQLLAADGPGRGTAIGSYGPGSSYGGSFTVVGARSFFQDCTYNACTLSATDGTAAGTGAVPALAPFTAADQRILAAFADRWLVFQSGDASYAYDVVDDRVLALTRTLAFRAYAVGASLYLLDDGHLWVSRLEAPEPSLVFQGPHPYVAGWRDDTLYFVPEDGLLRATDGRSVRRYKGARLENFSVLAEQLGTFHSQTLFPLPGYYTGGLYAADETTRVVREIHHICDGKYGCGPNSISPVTVVGEQAFMTIRRALWRSDGTPSGTVPHPVLGAADPDSFRVLDDRLVLAATSRAGSSQLWATDGSAAGTEPLSGGSVKLPLHVQTPAEPLDGALYVWGSRKPAGQQLWRVAEGRATAVTAQQHLRAGLAPYYAFRAGRAWVLKGGASQSWIGLSAAGTAEELPLGPAPCNGLVNPCPTAGVEIGERYLFPEDSFYAGLAVTDGTAAGTRALPLEDPDGVPSAVASLGPFRDRALILGDAGGLWTADGTPEGTRFVTQLPIAPAPASPGLAVGAPVAVGPISFLFRRVPVSTDASLAALELWRTDGTAAGTLRLASIPFDKQNSPYPAATPLAGRLFFRVFGVLWVSDGSPAGTRPVPRQLPGGTFALSAGRTILYAGAGYLVPQQPDTLWAIDPVTLRETRLGAFSSLSYAAPGFPLGSVVDDTLVFFATDFAGSSGWRRTEGTPASTVPLPEPLASNFNANFVSAGSRRYFSACDADHGCELWSTDRLGEDTHLVQDVWAGPRGSDPEILGSDERSLWFAATEPTVGRELWRLELSAAATGPRPASRLTARPSARERAAQARRALEPPWRRMLR